MARRCSYSPLKVSRTRRRVWRVSLACSSDSFPAALPSSPCASGHTSWRSRCAGRRPAADQLSSLSRKIVSRQRRGPATSTRGPAASVWRSCRVSIAPTLRYESTEPKPGRCVRLDVLIEAVMAWRVDGDDPEGFAVLAARKPASHSRSQDALARSYPCYTRPPKRPEMARAVCHESPKLTAKAERRRAALGTKPALGSSPPLPFGVERTRRSGPLSRRRRVGRPL